MRVISQNGEIDIPYEQSVFWIKSILIRSVMDGGEMANIYASTNGDQESIVLGTYGSKERAKEVLDMLLKHYCEIKESEFLGMEGAFFTQPFFILPKDGENEETN